jgi:hypothetical protein
MLRDWPGKLMNSLAIFHFQYRLVQCILVSKDMAKDSSFPEYFYFIFIVIILHLLNHFGCTMALGSTQPKIKINTSGVSWGVKAAYA